MNHLGYSISICFAHNSFQGVCWVTSGQVESVGKGIVE